MATTHADNFPGIAATSPGAQPAKQPGRNNHDDRTSIKPAEIAIGSRALDRSLIGVHQPGFRETAGKFFNAVMRATIGLPIADTQCGFKLFRGDVAMQVFTLQTLERFGFDVEILLIAARHGYRIAEVPVRWNHAEGSKVGMLTGLRAFVELAQVRINAARGRYQGGKAASR